jgi:hypothetical protein
MTTTTSLSAALVLAAMIYGPAALAGGDARGNADIRDLRLATAAFHSLQTANDAGWDVQLTECLSSPEGGMGYHYANGDLLFDDGVDELRPELLVYAPSANGGKRLVAVEYLVFTELQPNPPTLFGQVFHLNPGIGAWVLHVWLWQGNPNGLFADWNPAVRCD